MIRVPFFDCTPSESASNELERVASEVIKSGTYVGGQAVSEFEETFAHFLGGGHVVGVGNGLDALTLSLIALQVGPGDEVIVPSYSFIATWIAVARVGATCVVVDVEPETGLISLDTIRQKISPSTKAVIPVHLYGSPVHLGELRSALEGSGVSIVEDCAQSVGAAEPAGIVGTIGTVAAFSFYPTKNLGALGDGGAVFTRSEELAQRVRSLRSYGFGSSRYDFTTLGLNSRLDSIQAAFLTEKLKGVLAETKARRLQAAEYQKRLFNFKVVKQDLDESVFHHFPVLVPDREKFREALMDLGVETDCHYPYTFEAFARLVPPELVSYDKADLYQANRFASEVVTLPVGSWLSEAQFDATVRALEIVNQTQK